MKINLILIFYSILLVKIRHYIFQLLCRLIKYALMTDCPLQNVEVLLNNEITWLKKVREKVKETGEAYVEEALLEGHLSIAKELLGFFTPEKKYFLGSDEKKGYGLIKVRKKLVDSVIDKP